MVTKASIERRYDLIKHMAMPPMRIRILLSKDERDDWIGDIIKSRSFVRRLMSLPLSVPSKYATSCDKILIT